ncbi:MAG: hypothetical protein IPO21_18835 [Bacteroidales bacterium]|nr:hypothetical protein [Bacteroidales bacterium]
MRLLLILFLGIMQQAVWAQKVGVYAKIDTNQILIGDQISFTLTCIQDSKLKVQFPHINDTIIKGVEIVEAKDADTTNKEAEQFTVHKTYTITSFDSGAYMLPVGPFIVDNDTILGKSIFLSVNTMPIDTAQASIKPIKLPYEQPLTFEDIWIWVAIGILWIAIIVGLYIYQKRLNKRLSQKDRKPNIPSEPAHVTALKALDSLKNKQLWQSEKHKEYYSQLTEILRLYLELRYSINALEKTTDEIIDELYAQNVTESGIVLELKQILTTADLVKFAKQKPVAEENVNNLDLAYKIIDKTKYIQQESNTNTETGKA